MENIYVIHTDGGARGNPGPAGVGVVIEKRGNIIHEFGKKIGKTTNNVAEYIAVIEALQYLKTLCAAHKNFRVYFYIDSTLIVQQLNGRFKIKNTKLRELSLNIKILEQEVGGVITYHVIPREQNRHADFLVNQALDSSSHT